MQILRRAKLGCASVSALAFTRHSHWRGSIGAIFWPGQCYWEVTAIWHEHINSQRMSPKSLTSPGLSFPCIEAALGKPPPAIFSGGSEEVVLRNSLPKASL
ncbi:hypothetical protein OIU76_012621 [Salix suchowensis]|nr:hypothetical protein OIU76_012621 [Salix suchowensis]